MSLAADIPGSGDGIDEADRLVDYARASEEARRRLSREVTELMNRLQAEEERAAALELQRSEHAQLRAEHGRLQDEHARLRDDHAEIAVRLEAQGRSLREVEAARAAADAFAADTSRDFGEAMSDLLEARELGASLEAQVTGLRSEHDQLVQAHEALRLGAAAEQEMAETNLTEQRRAHDTLRAEAVVAFEQRLQEAAAAHERTLLEAQARTQAAETQAREVAVALQAITQSRDQVQAELEKSVSAVNVTHQRLREEVEARAAADERRSLLEDELTYLRAEIFAPGQAAGQKLGLRGRRGRRSPSPARSEPRATIPIATGITTDVAPAGPAHPAAEDRDSALERRLFGS